MPNTLVHIAIQTPLIRAAIGRGEFLTLALLGCIVPDAPWILQRIARAVLPLDLYDLRAYATVQATLLFSTLLAAALAVFFRQPRLAFATITAGCVIHLTLDAVETKWGNGIHYFAPFDWSQLNWGLVWPDNPAILVLTAAGLAVFSVAAIRIRPFSAGLVYSQQRVRVAIAGIAIYLTAPFLFLQSPYAADNHYLATLSERSARTGKPVQFDRVQVDSTDEGWEVSTYVGESLALESFHAIEGGTYSLKGVFLSPNRLRVTDSYLHAGTRDTASTAGVALVALWLLLVAGSAVRRRTSVNRTVSQSE